MVSMKLSSSSCAEIVVPLDLRLVSQGISGVAWSKTSHLSCIMGNGGLLYIQYRGVGIISIWFGIHWTISHSFGDIRVILDLWGCSWGLSGVQISKLRLLSCLIGNLELLCTQCRAIRPRLSPRGKTNVFSLVAAGTWGISLSFRRDGHWKLVIVQ